MLGFVLLLAACGQAPERSEAEPPPASPGAADPCAPPDEEAAVTDHWPVPPECELQPYPYVRPTPPAEPSPLDGVYQRAVTERMAGHVGKCRRCPPYRMESGQTNRIMLIDGVFRVIHEPGEFRSVGHFAVDGGSVTFVNDPNCPTIQGTYTWRVAGDRLTFEVVEDECAFGDLRSRYLTAAPWDRLAVT